MTDNNFTEKERIDAFAKALAIVLRRIAGIDSKKTKTLPENLPKPSKDKETRNNKKTKSFHLSFGRKFSGT